MAVRLPPFGGIRGGLFPLGGLEGAFPFGGIRGGLFYSFQFVSNHSRLSCLGRFGGETNIVVDDFFLEIFGYLNENA